LRDAGIKLALVHNTGQQGEIIDRHLELEGLLDFFPTRIYSSDVSYRKPDRRIFQFALNELGIRAPEAIYVGDSTKTDVAGARQAGMASVLLQRSGTGRADHTISSLSQLLRIPAIRERFEESAPPAKPHPPQRDPHLVRN
jgi:putative hydrolase of the HAD superfamily